jgi:hypothetical protein
VEILEDPKTLSGEDVLPGFVLDLRFLFEDAARTIFRSLPKPLTDNF